MTMNNNNSILLVDDNSIVLDAVSRLLKFNGFNVTPCKEAAEAIDHFKRESFHAVLTDIDIPEISGIELLEIIRGLNSAIPVVVMTGSHEVELAEKALNRGAFDFVTKPFDPDYLVHTMEKAADRNTGNCRHNLL